MRSRAFSRRVKAAMVPEPSRCENHYGYEYEREAFTTVEVAIITTILGLCGVAMLAAVWL